MSAAGFAMLTALCWGIAPVLARFGLATVDPLSALLIRTSVIFVILVAIAVFTGRVTTAFAAGWRPVAFLAAEGVLASLVGHLTYFLALRAGEASRVVPLSATFPLFTLVAAALLLGERITAVRVVGVLLVLGGVALIRR